VANTSFAGPFKRSLSDVISFYSVLVPHDGSPFRLKSIWRSKVPLRVTLFAWLAALGKILTLPCMISGSVMSWWSSGVVCVRGTKRL
jgi:hypothetical protein